MTDPYNQHTPEALAELRSWSREELERRYLDVEACMNRYIDRIHPKEDTSPKEG